MAVLLESLDCMLHQEEACYITVNYMDPAYQKGLIQALQCPPAALDNSNSSSSSGSSSSSSKSTINEFWREKIVEWCYQVVDHFDFSREVVSVAIHYLDRYLATKYVNKKMFQLAAMVSLYLAIKLHDPRRLSMAAMIELSRGCFVMEQMKAMEMELLRALSWRVHPPTAHSFAKILIFFMPCASISPEARHDVVELSRFLLELSVLDFHFVNHKASVVALASLLYSMHEISGVSEEAMLHFEAQLQKRAAGLCLCKNEVLECHERFRQVFADGGYEPPESTSSSATARNEAISPVCVSYGFAAEQYMLSAEQYILYGDPAAPTTHYHQISQKADDTTAASTSDGPIDVTVVSGSALGPSS